MSHQIVYNHSKNQLEVTTPYCIIDSASLVTPVKFQKDGKEQGEARHTVRALFDLSFTGAQDFLREIRDECRQLVDHVDQFHPSFLPEEYDTEQIVTDCIKVGSEVIAEKKALDAKAVQKAQKMNKPAPDKKMYNSAMDYLDGHFYLYARASPKFPPQIRDRDNQVLTPSSDEFFAPSFMGRLRLVIKRMPAFGSDDKELGGSLVAYMNGVQFVKLTPEVDHRKALGGFKTDEEVECMYNIPKKNEARWEDEAVKQHQKRLHDVGRESSQRAMASIKEDQKRMEGLKKVEEEDDTPIFGAPKKAVAKVAPRKAKDDIDDYTERF